MFEVCLSNKRAISGYWAGYRSFLFDSGCVFRLFADRLKHLRFDDKDAEDHQHGAKTTNQEDVDAGSLGVSKKQVKIRLQSPTKPSCTTPRQTESMPSKSLLVIVMCSAKQIKQQVHSGSPSWNVILLPPVVRRYTPIIEIKTLIMTFFFTGSFIIK